MMLSLMLGVAVAACTAVRGPLISAGDLARADTRFAVVPATAAVGYSPAPGSRRVFSETEMERLAKKFGVEGMGHELCFAFMMHKLDRATVVAAVQQVIPGSEVEVLETVNFDVPEGPLFFLRATLPKPPQSRPDEAVVWRGHIEYSESRKFTVWAKVRIAIAGQRVTAVRDLAAGQEIVAGDVEVRSGKFFPDTEHWAEKTEEVIGRRILGPLRAGAPIHASVVPVGGQTVARGDEVTVDVEAGAAHLRIASRAESSAALGGLVKLRNPKSGKVFEARVTGKGAAVVRAADGGMKEEK